MTGNHNIDTGGGSYNIHTGGGNYKASISGNYNESIAGNYIQGNYISMSQDLSQAAAQIQQLLNQLKTTQKCSPEAAQQKVAEELATQSRSDPSVRYKLVKWGQSLGDAAAKTTVTEAATAVVKLALTLAGISPL
jgi:hypothetical protein